MSEKYDKQELDELFRRLDEEYVPEYILEDATEAPKYTPTPKSADPKRLTIEQYKQRQTRQPTQNQQEEIKQQKKPRRGRKVRHRQAVAELHRLSQLTTNPKEKASFLAQIRFRYGRTELQRKYCCELR